MHPHRIVSVLLVPVLLGSFQSVTRTATPRSPRFLPPPVYALDFVGTAATGVAMNDLGDVVGTAYQDVGCGPFCLPPQDTVVWRGSTRIPLPGLPGLSGITVRAIDDQGWVVGFAGVPGTTTRALVWMPSGDDYVAVDLGTLPGTNVSEAIGIDASGRVVGWSTTTNFPPTAAPFLWTAESGMVDLTSLGFPGERPLGISPGGTVATSSFWYRLDDPSSVTPMAAPPSGYFPGSAAAAVNDAGDQGLFLVRTSGQNLAYLYRYHHEGVWQQLSPSGTGHLSTYGIGSIDARQDVTATILGTGVFAAGPDGLAQALEPSLSSAYPDRVVTGAGPKNARGEILARVMVGRSTRVVRMTPTRPCPQACLEVASVVVVADFVPDPSDPTQDHCSPALNAYNQAWVTVTVVDGAGLPVEGAVVSGRFLDDYWTDDPMVGTTSIDGTASFMYVGPCGVGAIAFLVDDVAKAGYSLDRTTGELSGWAIPQ